MLGSDLEGSLVGALSVWKSSISNSGHCGLGQLDPYILKPRHLSIQPQQLYIPGDIGSFSIVLEFFL